MKELRVEDALGTVLCHDMTEIIPGKFKGRAFKKGHIITEDDIEHLLRMGKEHVFVYELDEGSVHEEDAAKRMAAAACGAGITVSEISEGKATLFAAYDGVVKINRAALYECGRDCEICFSTIHPDRPVKKGDLLGGMRVIPLVVKDDTVKRFEKVCRESFPVISVLPIKPVKIGIVTTGNEVLKGRVKDAFGDAVRKKAAEYGCGVLSQVLTGDDAGRIRGAVMDFIGDGAGLVAVTGGMSVDPDDRTPAAIRSCGGEVVTYGAPVLPGAMFMLSYVNGVPVVGLPGCVMYAKRTIFDLVLPRLLAGERLEREDFVQLACGGQCLNCEVCVFPKCGFGA